MCFPRNFFDRNSIADQFFYFIYIWNREPLQKAAPGDSVPQHRKNMSNFQTVSTVKLLVFLIQLLSKFKLGKPYGCISVFGG